MSASPKTYDTLWESWRGDIDAMRQDIFDLHHHRTVWSELAKRVDSAGAPDRGFFLDAYTRMYVALAGTAVRRLAETDRRVVSLGRLIGRVSANAAVITKERFLTSWRLDHVPCRDIVRSNAEHAWDTHAGGGAVFRGDIALADLARLDETTAIVVTMVDKTIAHRDRKPPDAIPTFGDLDGAIATITELYQRYQLLLLGRQHGTMNPVIQGNWLAPFRKPLA